MRDSANTFSVGDLKVGRLVEFEAPFLPALEMLPGLTPELLEENRRWLTPHALTQDEVFRLCYQSYLVRTPHHTILIDSCVGNHKQRTRPEWHMRSGDSFMRCLESHGLGPKDIDYVMCTHLHVDHVGWNTCLADGRWVPTFPNARYIIGRREFDAVKAAHEVRSNQVFLDSVLPVVDSGKAMLVEDDFQIGDHVRLMPTPGHTPGHVSVCIGKSADNIVLTGDLLHVPLQLRYPELSFVRDADQALAARTRRAFLERYCDTPTVCCTAHLTGQPVGHVTRWREGFDLLPIAGI